MESCFYCVCVGLVSCWTHLTKALFSILGEHNFIIERVQDETRKVRQEFHIFTH